MVIAAILKKKKINGRQEVWEYLCLQILNSQGRPHWEGNTGAKTGR